jgi:hypothetical protein
MPSYTIYISMSLQKKSVTIDTDSGTVTGEGSDSIKESLNEWPGYTLLYGGTQYVKAPDPLHSDRDLAVFLFDCYEIDAVPKSLIGLIPKPEPIPDGAIA